MAALPPNLLPPPKEGEPQTLLGEFLLWLQEMIPVAVVLAVFLGIKLTLAHIQKRREKLHPGEGRFAFQVTEALLLLAMVIAVVLAAPFESETRGQLLQVITVGITAVIALSSTTLVANAMGGLMLRLMKNFKPGDYVLVDGQEGRVITMGLVHTEVQNADRNIVSLPNQLMISKATTVVRSSGTYVAASLGLGYDVPHSRVIELCEEAATESGLEDPFVHISELGDYAVTYRVAGFLPEVKRLLTARSRLRKCILATLHSAGIEIASPLLQIQRVYDKETKLIPDRAQAEAPAEAKAEAFEEKVFDIAEGAEKVEELRAKRDELVEAIEEAKDAPAPEEEEAKAEAQSELETMERKLDILNARITRMTESQKEDR